MQEFILSVSSLDRSYYDNSSSCDFRINLQNTMYKIQSCHAISGVVPCISSNINNPFLYLTLDELRSFNVRVSNGLNSVSDIIHIDHDTSGSSIYDNFINHDSYTESKTDENFKQLSSLTIKLFNKTGKIHSFGNDILKVLSFSNTNPATVTTSINHGLTNGSRVFFRQFTNGSSSSLNSTIDSSDGYIITTVLANTFTIPLDLTSQSANQYKTGIIPYTLGLNSVINYGDANRTLRSNNGWTNAPVTQYNFGQPHGLANGTIIKITGFDNGSTSLVNEIMNRKYAINVTGLNTFTIPVDLSGENATQPLTGNQLSLLGSGSYALADELQTTINFKMLGYQ